MITVIMSRKLHTNYTYLLVKRTMFVLGCEHSNAFIQQFLSLAFSFRVEFKVTRNKGIVHTPHNKGLIFGARKKKQSLTTRKGQGRRSSKITIENETCNHLQD